MIAGRKSRITKTDLAVLVVVLAAVVAAVAFVVRSDLFGVRGPQFSTEFSFREQARNIPREMIKYDKVLTIPTGFAAAAAVAVDARDNIYVAGDRSVTVWDRNGKRLRTALSNLGYEPRCIAVDEAGRIYLGAGAKVEVYSPDGKPEKTLPAHAENGIVTRVIPVSDGVFAAVHESFASGLVVRYDAAGTVRQVIELRDMKLLSRFLDVAVASDGLRVTNPGAVVTGRIRVYDFDGDFRYDWGRYDTTGNLADLSGCCNPAHIVALPDGRIVTSEKGAQAIVKVYHKDAPGDHGRLESVVAEFEGAAGLDLAVDSKQRICVLDTHSGEVHVFERKD